MFVERDDVPRYLDGMDDSGTPDTAVISVRLFKGERYVIRIRTHYADADSGLGVLIV